MNKLTKSRYFFLLLLTLLAFCPSVIVSGEETIDLNLTDDYYIPDDSCLLEDPVPPEEPFIPGTIEGTGTIFEVTDSEYLNITLVSSELVNVNIESIPEMITMHIESAEGATSAQITLAGLEPSTTYYKYDNDYHNLEELFTDASGTCVYVQALEEAHFVFIQPITSTIFLSDTGWTDSSGSDPGVGTWDPATLTGSLTTNVAETIQIDSDYVTLDGNGHTVSGSGSGYGVVISQRTGVTLRGVNVQGFSYGISLSNSSDNTLTGNTVSGNAFGIRLIRSSYNTLIGNIASNNTYGITLHYYCIENMLIDNTASDNYSYGFYLYSSDNNTLTSNTLSKNNHSGLLLHMVSRYNTLTENMASNNKRYGFYLSGNSHHNTLTGNTANSNTRTGIYLQSSYRNSLIENTASYNVDYHGFHIEDSSSNYLTGNTANANKGIGIYLSGNSPMNTLDDNTVSENIWGVYVSVCYTRLIGNIASSNNTGIYIRTDECDFIDNIVSNNIYGFWLSEGSEKNILKYNTVSENNFGITCYKSYSNDIFNNNFIDNATQARAGYYSDNFNLGYPTYGNYWSNWTSPDNNNDGIVDQPYNFIGGRDNFPWTTQNGWNQPPVATITGPPSGSINDKTNGIILQGSIYDPDINTGDTHTAVWIISNEDWIDDFELEGTVTGNLISDTLYFSEAGIYTIRLTVTDSKGASDTTTMVDNQEDMPAFVVIYDPDGGFVTGGGWFWSPLGAYKNDTSLEGKANFGFVSKYKKGASLPTGQTEFQFKMAGLNFHSNSYEWLVVAGTKAKYKGVGTINGEGEFKFMLTGIDAGINTNDSFDVDRFRIKIWQEIDGDEEVVYDNALGSDDDNDTTEIGGGSIKVHKAK